MQRRTIQCPAADPGACGRLESLLAITSPKRIGRRLQSLQTAGGGGTPAVGSDRGAGSTTLYNIRGKRNVVEEEKVRECVEDDPWIHGQLGPCAIGSTILACMPLPAGLAKADPAFPVAGGQAAAGRLLSIHC
jgi:hypothetical protein